jgi:hypothetical protein
MNDFPIQIDATSLFYRFFAIPHVADQLVSSRKVQTLQFAPGSYSFQVASALFADFSFTVTDDGTVDFDATCDSFIKGRGTSTLTIFGLEVTFDARRLTSADRANPNASGIILAGTTLEPGEDWITFRTVRLVPGRGNQLQQGSAQVASFTFDIKRDGTFAYESSMDSSQGGFLAGNGTSTLTLLGYPMAVDVTAVSNLLVIQPLRFFPASNTGRAAVVLLPADGFTLQLESGVSDLSFNVELNGNISFDSSLSDTLRLANEPLLTVTPAGS